MTDGATDDPIGKAAVHTPITKGRFASGYCEVTRMSDDGTISAPPTPCSARPTMSSQAPGATPATSDAKPKTARPRTKIRLASKRSESCPPSSVNAAITIE